MPPRKAFFSSQIMVPLEEALGKISADIVTVYPPGIPLLIPGEQITRDILDFLFTMKGTGATLDGLDPSNSMMKVVEPF
jgi:arginine decarboxylase